MNKFFDLHNSVTLKYQEIQLKFVDGVLDLERNVKSSAQIAKGLAKLVKLKKSYEDQLQLFSSTPEKVSEVVICFKCYASEKPCTDCD